MGGDSYRKVTFAPLTYLALTSEFISRADNIIHVRTHHTVFTATTTTNSIACVAGLQMAGKGEDEFEREARGER